MTTFAALGDSITLGMGDPLPQGGWRGWAALLADGLRDPVLHNLAAVGAQTHHIEESQLPAALALRPDIASVVAGINDTLRGGFNPSRVGASVERTVAALTASGAVVLTMRLPDPGQMLGIPAGLARPLARRMHAVNMQLDVIAARYGTLHFDAAGDPETYDRRNWSVDRLHPNERGHRLIACRFHQALEASGYPLGSSPDPVPSSPPPTRREEIGWMATRGVAWMVRRSVDLIPYLLFMTVREWFARSGTHDDEVTDYPGPAADAGRSGEPGSARLPG
jgi:lysophospholipase L1-like esterase